MKRSILLSAIVAGVVAFVGCGGGGGGTSLNSVGKIVDSAVANIDYDCLADGEYNKKSGANGEFQCRTMSNIRFRVGKLTLGTIGSLPQDGYVFPQDLLNIARDNLTNPDLVALARFLQALDEDGNLSNGITIPEYIKNELTQETNFNPEDLETYLNTLSIDPDHIPTATEAQEHLRETLRNIHKNQNGGNGGFDINNYPMSTLTQDLKDAIAHMGNEERLAYDVYLNLYQYHSQANELFPLYNIATKSESVHIETVRSIVNRYNIQHTELTNVTNPVANSSTPISDMPSGKYDITKIQDLYNNLYSKGQNSKQDALEVGCMVEVTDINDLDKYIQMAKDANAQDVEAAFEFLRKGSYNHYWAFDKALKDMGVSDGCCSLGSDYCHPEYPKNSNQGGANQGGGKGKQKGRNR